MGGATCGLVVKAVVKVVSIAEAILWGEQLATDEPVAPAVQVSIAEAILWGEQRITLSKEFIPYSVSIAEAILWGEQRCGRR